MTIDEIIAYIMHTPENTNPAILRDQLASFSSNQGSGSSELGDNLFIMELTLTEDNTVEYLTNLDSESQE